MFGLFQQHSSMESKFFDGVVEIKRWSIWFYLWLGWGFINHIFSMYRLELMYIMIIYFSVYLLMEAILNYSIMIVNFYHTKWYDLKLR